MIPALLSGLAVLALFGLVVFAPLGQDAGKGVCTLCGRRARLRLRPGKLAACRTCLLTDLTGHC